MSILGICLIVVGTIFSFIGTYKSDKDSQDLLTSKIQEKNQTIDNINSNNIKLIGQNTALLNSSNDAANSNRELFSQNKDMLLRIGNYQKDIESKEKKIKELEESVKKSERGIVSIIQIDGSYLVRQGGSMSINSGTQENKVYNEIINLEKEEKFDNIIILCDKSIKSSPRWYTPFLFKAIALYNLDKNNKKMSIDLLDYVANNTVGDPQYTLQISNLFSQIGEQAKAVKLSNSIPKEVIQDLINNQKISEQKKIKK